MPSLCSRVAGQSGESGRAKHCLSRTVLYVVPRRVRPLSYNSVGAVRPDVHDATKTPESSATICRFSHSRLLPY